MDIVGTEVETLRAPRTARGGLVLGVVRAARPGQWVKNLLVVAVPLAAGELLRPSVAIATAVAFACFTLTSAGSYLINDVCDVDEDRHHPTKRLRPIASFGSLFIAAGKRHSELRTARPRRPRRRSLASYSESYLRFVWGFAASVTITAYGLWAFEMQEVSSHIWAPLSLAPFMLGVLRYALDIDRGTAGTPEDIAYSDHVLQGIGVIWLLLVVLQVAV